MEKDLKTTERELEVWIKFYNILILLFYNFIFYFCFSKVLKEKEKGLNVRLAELEEKNSNTHIDPKREKELEKQAEKCRKGTRKLIIF